MEQWFGWEAGGVIGLVKSKGKWIRLGLSLKNVPKLVPPPVCCLERYSIAHFL